MKRALLILLCVALIGGGIVAGMWIRHKRYVAFYENAGAGDVAAVQKQIDRGINVDRLTLVFERWDGIPLPTRQTALIAAAREGHAPVVRALLDAGADPDVVGNIIQEQATALSLAASRYQRAGIVRMLLDVGADPLRVTAGGKNAMGWAATDGDYESYLLLRGASYNAGMHQQVEQALIPEMQFRSDDWVYPIKHMISMTRPMTDVHRIARDGIGAALGEAITLGSDPNHSDVDGWTALHWAAGPEGDLERVRVLLEAGADPNATTQDGYTALMGAALKGDDPDIVRALVAAGADVDAVNSLGNTALHAAAWAGEERVVRVLIELGADTTIENNWEVIPRFYAESRRRNLGIDVTGAF